MSTSTAPSSYPVDVLDQLSFRADTSLDFTVNRNAVFGGMPRTQSMQGVLWKRRDVFKNRWRPRWFVLHPDQQILTYYLLVNNNAAPTLTSTSTASASASTSTRTGTGTATNVNRERTHSETSDVSQNTTDYDVLPRGTIYLGGPCCTVETNDGLTRASENLYALTISDKENSTQCHLAARSPQARQRWIQQLQRVMQAGPSLTSRNLAGMPTELLTGTIITNEQTEVPTTHTVSAESPPTASTTMSVSKTTDGEHVEGGQSKPEITITSRELAEKETETTNVTWKTIPSPRLTDNLPGDLAEQIDLVLGQYLPYVDDPDHPAWKFNSDRDGIHFSTFVQNPTMIRTMRTAKHHPADYLQLIWDFETMSEIEANTRFQRKTKTYNTHTCLVHTAYHRVWPTAARDFASVAHWRLLENDLGQKALCIVAFSCPQANALQSTLPHHVRGTLHVSLNFWRHLPDEGCAHTRILSYDLNGKIPKALIQAIVQQQASLPRMLDIHLQKSKADGNSAMHSMDYETLRRGMNESSAVMTSQDTVKDTAKSYDRLDSIVAPPSTTIYSISHPQVPSVWNEAFRLMAPFALYRLFYSVDFRFDYLVFLSGVVHAVRWIILQHLLQHFAVLPSSQAALQSSNGATTTCRFTVDLQGVLRFLEEETQQNDSGPKISVKHVILRALARAMAQQPGLVTRQYPFLPPLFSMDVLIHDDDVTSGCPMRTQNDQLKSLREIADEIDVTEPLWFAPACQVRFNKAAETRLEPTLIDVSVTDTTVDMTCGEGPPSSLSVAIKFKSQHAKACRKFAERVRQAIQYQDS